MIGPVFFNFVWNLHAIYASLLPLIFSLENGGVQDYRILPENSTESTHSGSKTPKNLQSSIFRGILFLTLRDEEKENKGLSIFPIINIATGYADYYF